MQPGLDTQLLTLTSNMKGHFSSAAKLAEQLDVPEWRVRQELDRLLIMLKIDRFELITAHTITPYYGVHRGVRPAQARLNQLKGNQ